MIAREKKTKIEFVKQEEDRIDKYEITLNYYRLDNIVFELNRKYIREEHIEIDTEHPEWEEKSNTRNFESKVIGSREDREYMETHNIYHVSYDKIVYSSKIAILVEDLIKNGNIEILDYINGNKCIYDFDKAQSKLEKLHNKIVEYLDKRDYRKAKIELESIIPLKEEIQFFTDENSYLDQIKKYIKIKKIDSITNEEVERVNSFTKIQKLDTDLDDGPIKLSDIDKYGDKLAKPVKPNTSPEYEKLQKEASERIEAKKVEDAKAMIRCKNFVALSNTTTDEKED